MYHSMANHGSYHGADTEVGIEAVWRGYFYSVGLSSADVSKAHLVLPNLADVHVKDVLEHLKQTTNA
jgi:hypothetical protein